MADNDQLLEKIRAIIREETVSKEEFRASEERLTKKIEASQEDTIEVLSEVIHTGYNMHEKRISAIEEQLDIPHPKEN
jgi:hypothetical protein